MQHIGVLTSGGDAPGMNAAIRAVVRAAEYYNVKVTGIRSGYQGMIDGDFQPMTARSVSDIIHHGGTILQTARCEAFRESAGRDIARRNLEAAGIEGVVVIGGDGSYRGAHKLYEEQGIPTIGVPGTIDNDIGGTDYTIGFFTAINTAVEAIDRIRDTAASHDRIFFVEVMGRSSGYIAIISGIAGGAEEILVPESPTDFDKLIGTLRKARDSHKHSMIILVAEGDEAGGATAIAQRVARDSEFTDTRVSVIGHIQRGGAPSAMDRVIASRMGVASVQALLQGEGGMMVGIDHHSIELRPLSDAWETHSRFDPALLDIAKILSI